MLGLLVAFGHSVLAMSGEETLAQVYREVESPKLKNFKKAAFIVFLYSMLLTTLISFFAVMIIPDNERIAKYSGNLIGGLAMSVAGPHWAKLCLNALVVGVGFLILSGAVNTAIIGSNGVLNRVSEDGVLPDWFLKPHPKYGTTNRLLNLVVGLQLFTIIFSRGKILTLGEACLRRRLELRLQRALDARAPIQAAGDREYEVPLNLKLGRYDFPLGILLIFLVLALCAMVNFMTKEVATISGVAFTTLLFLVFWASDHAHASGWAGTPSTTSTSSISINRSRRRSTRRRSGSPSRIGSWWRSARRTTWRCSTAASAETDSGDDRRGRDDGPTSLPPASSRQVAADHRRRPRPC